MPNIRALCSLSVQGHHLAPGESAMLVPVPKSKSIRNGILRVHNVSNIRQTLSPAKVAQKQWPEFVPEIPGDDQMASLPMAWNNPSLRFEIIALPASILPNGVRKLIKPEKYTFRGSTWTMKELVSAVEAPPGSPAPGPNNPGNYMGYDRTNWQVYKQETQQGVLLGVIIAHGRLYSEYETSEGEFAYLFETLGRKIAFVVSLGAADSYDFPDDSLRHFLDKIGTSGCISLLQKAIRRRPVNMEHPETRETWATQKIVLRIVQRHCRGVQQGFFLPTIGKFVSGFQHFLKRLFIIAAEDSFYDEDDMFAMSSMALLASLQPLWMPDEATISKIVEISLNLLMSSQTSAYKTNKDWLQVSDFKRAVPSLVQAEMGGMQGDQRMLRWLALHHEDCNRIGEPGRPLVPQTDPLDIYCDQHQDGRLVCLLQSSGTYPEMLSRAFRAVSGFNTRRNAVERRIHYQQMVFDGLRQSSKLLRGIVPEMPSRDGPEMEYQLPNGAIAGMVGTLEIVHSRSKYFVTVSARDIRKFVVIPKPTRDNKRGLQDITPELCDAILVKAKLKLSKGRRVCNPIEDDFKGKTIHYQDSGWWLDGRPWQEQRNRIYRQYKTPDWSKLTETTTGPVSWSMTFGSGHAFSNGARQFALGRMAGYDPLITIPKINREGKGTDEALTGFEAEAYQYFQYLSEHFPDAIWPSLKKPFAFESSSIAFRRILCGHLRAEMGGSALWTSWQSQLVLKPEQLMAVQEMKTSEQAGLASFLWMLVGQGKTLTVLRFLEETRISRFIVWSLPKTAVSSVAAQIMEVGWQPMQLYPSKGLKKKHSTANLPATTGLILRPEYVYLIEHDHLRKVTDALAGQMGQTAFIFDEVHKAMQSGTKRTASALRLARIAKQLVALTGTPIVDKSGYGLMQWLRLCVPFPVSASNFWVAANSMVSPLNTGDVIVEDLVVQAPETDEDKAFFKQNFPARAPWHGQLAVPTVQQWSRMKTRTTEIVTNEIVRLTAELVARHPNDGLARHSSDCAREKSQPESAWQLNYQRPLVVASSSGHVVQIVQKLLQRGVSAEDILCVGGARPGPLAAPVHHQKTIHLTEQAVLTGEERPYKLVVAALRYCEGYSLTWMTCMITGSYPSNQASRTQMRGRINRLDAQRLRKKYITVLAGTTTVTFRHQRAAKMMEDALRFSTGHRSKKQKKTSLHF